MKFQDALNNILQNKIDELYLSHSNIDDKQSALLANALQNNQSLTFLNLGWNQVGDAGASALANALQNNHSLTNLYLSHNQVGAAGASALANAIQNNHSLTNLDLDRNQVGAAGASALATALQNNHSLTNLYLSHNQVGAAGASALANAIQNNHSLTSLGLGANKVGAAGASALANALQNNHSLTKLDLSANQVGDAGASALANALQNNHSLTNLDLGWNQVGAAGASALATALQNNHSLTNLNIEWNQVGAAGASALANALQNNHSLTNLDLRVNQVGAAGASALANALQNNHSLTKLDLSGNQVGVAGASALANALQNNHSLTNLDLRHNQVGAAGASALANALQNNHSLTKLDLRENQVGDAGASALANALQNNHSLTKLDLRENQVGDAGASALATALQNNHSLTNLDLGGNQVGDAGASALATALQNNHSLTNLYLGWNQVGDAGASALANALQNNHSLTNLDLYDNQVGDATNRFFNEAWKAHQSRCKSVQETAIAGNEQTLIAYFNQYQQFPSAVLSLLIQHKHFGLVMCWNTYWHSAALNYQDNQGNTPLHHAIQLNDNQCIAWLLTKPVALTKPNQENQSPLVLLEAASSLSSVGLIKEFRIGSCYFLGQGIKVDKVKARDYYEKASKENYKPATWLLNLLNLLDEKTYIELMAIDTLIGINEPLPQLTLDEMQTLILSIATPEGKLLSTLTQQDYTLYHLAAYLGSLEWLEILQTLTSSSTPLLSPNLILRKNQQNLFPSALAKQQAKLIAENKGIQLNDSEAEKDTVLLRYRACELALQKLEKLRLNLLKDLLIKLLTKDNSLALLESQLTELLKLNPEEIKSLLELITTSEYRLVSSLTAQDYTLYHLCALLGSMSWFGAVQIFTSSFEENVSFFSQLILAKTSPQGLRPSELAQQQKHFIAQEKGFALDSSEAMLDETFQRYQTCELALRETEKKAYVALLVALLTEFLKGKNKTESIVIQLATLNLEEIKELVTIITNSESKLSSFFSPQEYTPYHLAAELGSPNWCQALQVLSASNNYLTSNLVLVKNQQGLRPSALAKQQRKFIAEDRGIQLNTPEADQDEILIRYKACEIVLRQAEESVLLNLWLAEQRNQQQVRLDYEGRAQALKDNIDLLSWQPENLSNEVLIVQYAQVLQQIWSAKQTCSNLKNQFKERLKWPEGFDPFALTSPGQTLNHLVENSPSYWITLQYKIQGPIAYAHYQYECALQWLKLYTAITDIDFSMQKAYTQGKVALEKLMKAYQNYENLWKEAATIDEKQWLLSTPVLLLQADKTPSFITPLIAEDKTLSPATKLSYFLNEGEKIEDMAGAGTAPVFSIQGVHYKRNPHAPGVEFMVSSLGKVLAGEGATPTELVKVIGPDGIPYAYQASHTVKGKDLQSLLLNHPEYINKIRSDNFAAVVVLGILTDPQDGKPDNYMVEFSQDDQGNITQIDILGIDNDIAFSDVVFSQHKTDGKTDKYIMNIKNALYFFPQMMLPIEASFRDKLLSKQPEFILLEWLQLLLTKNKEYETLLTEGIFTLAEYAGDGLTNKRGLQLPIKVVPGTMARVYRKLKQLHATLTQQPNITLWDLLMVIEPEVAIHYAKVKIQYPHDVFGCDVMKCIHALYEENVTNGKELMWFRDQLDKGYTHTMTTLVLRTAEEFGFEDNRNTSLKESVISLLKCLNYESFKGLLAPVLYQALEALIKESELKDLLTTVLAHNCGACGYWLWQESVIERAEIQNQCEALKKYSLLHFFAQNKHLEGVKVLMSQGVYPVNICNSQGYTPLHMAASVGDSAIVEYLVENKAYVNAKTTLGNTALMMAESRCKEMNEQIPEKGDKKYADIIAYLKRVSSRPVKQENSKAHPAIFHS